MLLKQRGKNSFKNLLSMPRRQAEKRKKGRRSHDLYNVPWEHLVGRKYERFEIPLETHGALKMELLSSLKILI